MFGKAISRGRGATQNVLSCKPKDWENLCILDPSTPHLAGQLTCLRLIKQGLEPETPFIQTIFSPLAQAKNLAGNDTLISHLRLFPEAVMKGLETIARSTRQFVEAVLDTGVDGVFYAIQHAQAALLSLKEYQIFGLPFDKKIMEPAAISWLNLLHLHGREVYFTLSSQLPFPIINWHDRETAPSLVEARKTFQGSVCGGLRQNTLVYEDQARVRQEARDAIDQSGRNRFILSTGCVVPVIAPHGNLFTARESVKQ